MLKMASRNPNSDTWKELGKSSIFCCVLPSESDLEYVSSFPLESDSNMSVISSMVEKKFHYLEMK